MDDKDSRNIKNLKQVLIIGGGITGLSAAKALGERDVCVHIVEKQKYLGGNAFEWPCMATDECQSCGACLIAELVDEIENLKNTNIYSNTIVKEIQSEKNKIRAKLEGSVSKTLVADAVLVASGFNPFDPSSLDSLKYAKDGRVITTRELNKLIREEKLQDLFISKEQPRIAFIQCVGSRNREQGRDYCSQVCCKVALRQINKILYEFPDADITMFYMDLQIIGKEIRYRFDQIKDRIKLVQGVPGEILNAKDQNDLIIVQEDEISGERVAHYFDNVILSVGMIPPSDSSELFGMLGIETDQWGFSSNDNKYLVKNVYTAGTARGPMDILNSQQEGKIAAQNIARRLGMLSDPRPLATVAILGNGDEGVMVTRSLLSWGYEVKFIDLGKYDLEKAENLEYFPNSQLLEVSGTSGNFSILFDSGNGKRLINVVALVVATGSDKERKKIRGLENGQTGIMGLNEFEKEIISSPKDLPKRIVFLLDYKKEEWKDNTRRSIQMASSLAEKGKEIFIFMKKMLVNGLKGQQIYDKARKNGVRFLRMSEGSAPSFFRDEDFIQITMNEATLGNIPVTVQCDLIVFPEEVYASERNAGLGNMLGIEQDREGFLQTANTRHRLISSTRKGIFFLGSCHDEIDDDDMKEELSALKASLLRVQEEGSCTKNCVVRIDEKVCGRCLTCFRTCPHGAIILREHFQPEIIPEACFNCGQCVSSCPATAIAREDMGETLLVDRSTAKETVVFMCRRSAALAEKEARRLNLSSTERSRLIPVDCAGSVSIETILSPFLYGTQKVIIAGCHRGNCRSGYGGNFATKQLQRVSRDTGIDDSRLSFQGIAANEPFKINRILSK